MTAMPWTAPVVPLETEVEVEAAAWVAPYDQVAHLMRARDWLVHLNPRATVEMRVATMTHDMERMFPGGPRLHHATQNWDDPAYLFAHSLRSAEAVGVWLGSTRELATAVDVHEVQRLVALHEVGGLRGADDVQAADSLSFLETLAGLTRQWVLDGTCSHDKAAEKLIYSFDRIRIPNALEPGKQLLERALGQLPSGQAPADQREVATV